MRAWLELRRGSGDEFADGFPFAQARDDLDHRAIVEAQLDCPLLRLPGFALAFA